MSASARPEHRSTPTQARHSPGLQVVGDPPGRGNGPLPNLTVREANAGDNRALIELAAVCYMDGAISLRVDR